MVFFDDYANCDRWLFNAARYRQVQNITRKIGVLGRQYCCTVATLALVSTWIGYEVSLMESAHSCRL